MTYDTLNDHVPADGRLRDFIGRHAWRLAGLALLMLTGALIASLVSWRVDDPSFSYAIDGPADNLLGRPGAAFADLAMQFFGLAVLGLVLPLALTALNLFRLRRPRRLLRQLAAWLIGAVLLATALSCLPAMANWPLPTGLGGALGDVTLGVAEWFGGGSLSAGLYAAFFVVLLGLALGFLWTACLSSPAAVAASIRVRPRRVREEEDDIEGEAEDSVSEGRSRLFGGFVTNVAGFLAHSALSLKGMLARQIARRTAHAAEIRAKLAARGRREPRFQEADVPAPSDADFRFAEDPEFDDASPRRSAKSLARWCARRRPWSRCPRRVRSRAPGSSARRSPRCSHRRSSSCRRCIFSPTPRSSGARTQPSTRARLSKTPGCSKGCSRISACAARSSTSAPARS
jgi:S-DNA-T family DNA segregation ATPase FtsK/SpoIIIE